jgi:hypothetical protein
MKEIQLKVSCYAGYKGEETPREFVLGDNHIRIEQIIDRWLSPNHRYFKLIGDDGNTYIIRHDIETYTWELTFYQATK